MTSEEKAHLRDLIHAPEGLLTVQVFMAGMNKRKIAQKLIAVGYVEEFTFKNLPCVRATQKSYLIFEPLWKRAWAFFTDDMAKILSIIAIIMSILLGLREFGLL